MFCEHCGTKRENDHQFCANCGSKVIETTTNVPHVSPISETSKESSTVIEGIPKIQTGNKSKKKLRWGWLFLCYGIFASLKGNPDIVNTDATNFFTALFFLVGIVLAPLLYYHFRDKFFKFIKNEGIRYIVVGFVFIIGFVFSISILGAVCNRIFLGNSEQVTQEAANLHV